MTGQFVRVCNDPNAGSLRGACDEASKGGHIAAIYAKRNPEKLASIRLRDLEC